MTNRRDNNRRGRWEKMDSKIKGGKREGRKKGREGRKQRDNYRIRKDERDKARKEKRKEAMDKGIAGEKRIRRQM